VAAIERIDQCRTTTGSRTGGGTQCEQRDIEHVRTQITVQATSKIAIRRLASSTIVLCGVLAGSPIRLSRARPRRLPAVSRA
jgi:hypothetical protein